LITAKAGQVKGVEGGFSLFFKKERQGFRPCLVLFVKADAFLTFSGIGVIIFPPFLRLKR